MVVRRVWILWALLLAGCALDKPYCDRACVSSKVQERTGHFLGATSRAG